MPGRSCGRCRPDARPPCPDSPPLLAARGLHYARNDIAVFGPLDFAVDVGEALLVQGDNGAGKTTLLRVLAGLLRADGGAIAIEGHDATPALRARAVAYLGHLPALKADLTVLENLDFLCGLHGRRPSQLTVDALATVGLAGYEDVLARQLSAGQRSAVAGATMAVAGIRCGCSTRPTPTSISRHRTGHRMVQAHLHDGGAAW